MTTELNRTYVLYNLEEAQEEIGLILRDLKRDPAYTEAQLERALRHVVHHVNIAWNARHARAEALHEATDDELTTWSQYPTDLEPL
jgi:hypothetical protein